MSTVKVWGLGDAVVDLLPEKPGTGDAANLLI